MLNIGMHADTTILPNKDIYMHTQVQHTKTPFLTNTQEEDGEMRIKSKYYYRLIMNAQISFGYPQSSNYMKREV